MAYTPNQISDAFTKSIGRAPTPYEMKTYATVSPQALAGLKDTYSKYNTSASISDYLKHSGIDPAMAGDLAKAHGITGIGTAEGNTALLNALKTGAPAPATPALGGSVAPPAAPAVPAATTPATGQTQPATDPSQAPAQPLAAQTVGGSIAGAAGGAPDPAMDPLRIVNDAYAEQQRTQQALRDLDATLAGEKQAKIAEIARSGGVVNEASLEAQILRDNEPLLIKRRELVSQYTKANQDYQKAVSDRNMMLTQENRSAQLGQGQQKIDAQQSQFAQKEHDVQTKLAQSGWKVEKTNVTDSAGNVLGQQLTAVDPSTGQVMQLDANGGEVTPAGAGASNATATDTGGSSAAAVNNVSGIKKSGSFVPFASSKESFSATVSQIQRYQNGTGPSGMNGSTTLTQFANMWITGTKDGTGIVMGYNAHDLATKLGVSPTTPIGQIDSTKLASAVASFETGYNSTTDSFAGTSSSAGGASSVVPTITSGASPDQVLAALTTGKAVTVKGSTTPYTQESLYNMAVDLMMGVNSTSGTRTPPAATALVQNKKDDIMKAYGLTEADVNVAKAEFKGMTSANTQLLARTAFTAASAYTANGNLQLALDASGSIPRGGAKIENKYSQWAQGNFTPAGPLAQFEVYIYTAAREYAKVTSGGAASASGLTDTATAKADALLSAAQSPEAFKATVLAMQNDMKNVTNGLNNQTSAFPAAVKALYGVAGTAGDKQAQTPSTLPEYVQTKISGHITPGDTPGTAYMPRAVWDTLGADKDAVLAEAEADGVKLLIK